MTDDKPTRVELLHEAAALIDGDRNVSYGTPTQNFTNIAEMWTTRLRHKMKDGEEITPLEVADLMILLKVARSIAQAKRDTYVDIAGYAGCAWEANEGDPEPAKVQIKFAEGGMVSSDEIVQRLINESKNPRFRA